MSGDAIKPSQFPLPVLGFAAFSGTGKTTLLRQLIPLLRLQGLRLGMIKQSHHDIELDTPGKDSYELRQAGAQQMLLVGPQRSFLAREYEETPSLPALVAQLQTEALDLVLVEGFRHQPFARIELHRPATGKPLLFVDDPHIIAVACDEALDTGSLPLLNLNSPEEVAGFINRWLAARQKPS